MGRDKAQRPLDLRTGADPDFLFGTQRTEWNSQAAASTALGPRGVYGLASTSTDETPLVHSLAPPVAGDILHVSVENLATSSSPIHVDGGGTQIFDCATQAGSTASADMITLSSAGAGISLVASSSGRWHVIGNNGCTLSTST